MVLRLAPVVLALTLGACSGEATSGGEPGDDAGAGLDATTGGDAGATDAGRGGDAGVTDAATTLDATTTTDAGPPAGELFRVTFEPATVGPYDRGELDAEWGDVVWASIDRVEVMAADGTSEGQFVRVHYPEGGVGPGEGGAQFRVDLPASFERLFVAYRVRFASGFDFVRGGKLPGLIGGEGNTGGNRPDGTDGWSARMMWRTDGDAVQYVYHPDQPGTYGEDFAWDLGGQRRFDDAWHVVEHEIVMNTPGENDGAVRGWWDGELALDRGGVRFRDVDTFAIDGFYFSTFFGGSDSSWAPTRDEHVDFDTFVFSESPITH